MSHASASFAVRKPTVQAKEILCDHLPDPHHAEESVVATKIAHPFRPNLPLILVSSATMNQN
jgi:hypothetical protein